jgi:hypothetical protein
MTFPHLADRRHRLLRLNSSKQFPGLIPMIRHGSFAAIEEEDMSPPRNGPTGRDVRNRPIYVVRFQSETLWGYLEGSDTHLALQAHPLAGVPRLRFPRSRVQILGRVIAVASPLQCDQPAAKRRSILRLSAGIDSYDWKMPCYGQIEK